MMNRINIITLFCLLLGSFTAFGQVVLNDECETAIVIDDPLNYCSGFRAFTNVGATPSAYGSPSCFTNVSNDVWFSFTALATDVVITTMFLPN